MKRHFSTLAVSLLLVTLLIFPTVRAQQSGTAGLLQLAHQYEEQQAWEDAVKIYQQLTAIDPTNFIFFQGLQRSYIQLKRYEEAIALTKEWCNKHPEEIAVRITLAGLYYDNGNEDAADSLWNRILLEAKQNTAVYRAVAQEMLQHRLYEKAIATYLAGRTISGNPVLFADEVGMLYFSLQEYEKGAEEYIRLLKARPDNLSFVQSRFNSVVSFNAAVKVFTKTLSGALNSASDNIPLLQLLAWLQLQAKDPFAALETTKKIDQIGKRNGNEILQFAQRLAQERFLEAAATAYSEYLQSSSPLPQATQASKGYADVLYELAKQQDTVRYFFDEGLSGEKQNIQFPASYKEALRWYYTTVSRAPSTDIAAHCWFQIGVLYYEHLTMPDSALAAFRNVLTLQRETDLFFSAAKKLCEVFATLGKLDEAQTYCGILTSSRNGRIQQEGWYWHARLEYYRKHIDSALTLLTPLTTQLSSDFANDALRLQLFLQENKATAPQALAEFAEADFLVQQGKFSEATERYRSIIQRYPQAPLVDDAYLACAEAYLRMFQPQEALGMFHFLADSLPLSIWKDKALWRIGWIQEKIFKNVLAAVQTYETLLARFPSSMYADEARKRIRLLRGETPRIQ